MKSEKDIRKFAKLIQEISNRDDLLDYVNWEKVAKKIKKHEPQSKKLRKLCGFKD